MATYPLTRFSKGTDFVARESTLVDIASDGTPRGVITSAKVVYDVKLIHRFLTAAEASSLESFWSTYQADQIDVTWKSETYELYFLRRPVTRHLGGGWWSAECDLVGNRDDGG